MNYIKSVGAAAVAVVAAFAVLTVSPEVRAEKKPPPMPERKASTSFTGEQLACLDHAVKTANSSASPLAKQVLAYFRSLGQRQDQNIVMGQFLGGGDWSGIKEITQVKEKTGKWVAMVGNDYALMHDTSTKGNTHLIKYWNDGGLVTVSFHQLNPEKRRFGSVTSRGIDFSELLRPGSKSHETWKADLDRVAVGLAELRDYGVAVLWRPYHEMNKNFFWWGGREPADFVQLWRQMFDYLTKEKKLDNLLWVYSPYQAADSTKYYPGDDYVDIVSLDAYETNPANIQGYEELVRIDKPFGFGEFGPSGNLFVFFPVVDKNVDYYEVLQSIKQRFPKTSFIHAWNGPWGFHRHKNVDRMFADPAAVTRENLEWRRVCVDSGR